MSTITKFYNKAGQEREADSPDAYKAVRLEFDKAGRVLSSAVFFSSMPEVKAADPKIDLAKKAALEAAKKRFTVNVNLTEGAGNSINKVIQAAINAFSNAVDSEVLDSSEDDGDGEDDQPEKQMGYQWLAVLDSKTCDQCEFYDGQQWDSNYQPLNDGPEYPGDPGLHPNCRCSVVPVDLGGEPVPVQNFDDYLAGFSRSEQEAAFGKEALRAYHRGDITASQLIGQKSNLISLEDFKKL